MGQIMYKVYAEAAADHGNGALAGLAPGWLAGGAPEWKPRYDEASDEARARHRAATCQCHLEAKDPGDNTGAGQAHRGGAPETALTRRITRARVSLHYYPAS